MFIDLGFDWNSHNFIEVTLQCSILSSFFRSPLGSICLSIGTSSVNRKVFRTNLISVKVLYLVCFLRYFYLLFCSAELFFDYNKQPKILTSFWRKKLWINHQLSLVILLRASHHFCSLLFKKHSNNFLSIHPITSYFF